MRMFQREAVRQAMAETPKEEVEVKADEVKAEPLPQPITVEELQAQIDALNGVIAGLAEATTIKQINKVAADAVNEV